MGLARVNDLRSSFKDSRQLGSVGQIDQVFVCLVDNGHGSMVAADIGMEFFDHHSATRLKLASLDAGIQREEIAISFLFVGVTGEFDLIEDAEREGVQLFDEFLVFYLVLKLGIRHITDDEVKDFPFVEVGEFPQSVEGSMLDDIAIP